MATSRALRACLALLVARCAAYSPGVVAKPGAGGLLRAPAGWTPAQTVSPIAARSVEPQMPIGVPKVAYRVPGASSADWVDIYNRLYRERLIFLGQEIDDEICNQIIAVMLFGDSVRARVVATSVAAGRRARVGRQQPARRRQASQGQ